MDDDDIIILAENREYDKFNSALCQPVRFWGQVFFYNTDKAAGANR